MERFELKGSISGWGRNRGGCRDCVDLGQRNYIGTFQQVYALVCHQLSERSIIFMPPFRKEKTLSTIWFTDLECGTSVTTGVGKNVDCLYVHPSRQYSVQYPHPVKH